MLSVILSYFFSILGGIITSFVALVLARYTYRLNEKNKSEVDGPEENLKIEKPQKSKLAIFIDWVIDKHLPL